MSELNDPRLQEGPRLGELLREAREERGLDLSQLSATTHVRADYLAALEEGRYSDLPEDVYARNFLRLYAQAVGFDTVRALELYRSERRDADGFNTVEQKLERDRELAANVPPATSGGRWWVQERPAPRWAPLLSTILMVAAVVGLALWGFNSTFFNPSRSTGEIAAEQRRAGERERDEQQIAQPESEREIPRTVRLSVSSTPPGAEVLVDGFPLPGTTPIESAPVTARPSRTILVTLDGYEPAEAEFDLTFDRNISFALTPAARGQGADATAPAQNADGPNAAGQTDATPDQAAPQQTPVAAPGQAASAEQANGAVRGRGQATLTITEDTWLEVYSGTARYQGRRLAFTNARPGQVLSFPLPVYIHVGNAGGVELTVDGQERGTLGSSGEVRGVAVSR